MSGSMKVRIKTLICTLPFVGISIYIKKKRKKKIVNSTGSGMGSRKSLEKGSSPSVLANYMMLYRISLCFVNFQCMSLFITLYIFFSLPV